MFSLADELAKLSDPTPKLLDPEDDINVETTARVVERFDEGSGILPELSSLRQDTAPLLEDLDARYVGRRISRKSLDQTSETGSESPSGSGESESEDDAEVDEDLDSFKQQVRKITDLQDSSYNDQLEDGTSSEACSSGSGSEEEESNEVDSDGKRDTDAESDEEEQETEEDNMFQKFARIDVSEEIEKGKAVEAQLGIWNKLCECRIRFQKILTAANRLPQFDTWNDFKMKGDQHYSNVLERGPAGLKSLLDSMLELQSGLLQSNPEINSFVITADTQPAEESDEKIPSGSESESEEAVAKSKKRASKREVKKRKLKLDEYSDILAKRFKAFMPYRNSVIQKWDDKTRLITGRMTQKSFNAFNQSALKQIDQILQDKQRLIRRTQLKRSVYSVLGKNEDDENTHGPFGGSNEEEHTKRDEHLNHYDPEIFDDDDFYQVLLKDVIESKSVRMDPDLLRTHMEIQKTRRKMKKKVDTKASKGRKLSYDVHPKMVHFATPVPNPLGYSDEKRDELFKNIFKSNSARPAM